MRNDVQVEVLLALGDDVTEIVDQNKKPIFAGSPNRFKVELVVPGKLFFLRRLRDFDVSVVDKSKNDGNFAGRLRRLHLKTIPSFLIEIVFPQICRTSLKEVRHGKFKRLHILLKK
jgi:hypothetical protein